MIPRAPRQNRLVWNVGAGDRGAGHGPWPCAAQARAGRARRCRAGRGLCLMPDPVRPSCSKPWTGIYRATGRATCSAWNVG